MRGLGELWQAARGRHALKAVTLLRGRQDSEDQNGCREKRSEWSIGQLRMAARTVGAMDGDSQNFIF